MANKPVHNTAKEVLAQKSPVSEQMAQINLRWHQMRLLELKGKPQFPQKAANISFDEIFEEESA